jgi:hypothetical protein
VREPVGAAVRCTPEMHGPTEIGGFYTAEIFFRVTNSLHVLVVGLHKLYNSDTNYR